MADTEQRTSNESSLIQLEEGVQTIAASKAFISLFLMAVLLSYWVTDIQERQLICRLKQAVCGARPPEEGSQSLLPQVRSQAFPTQGSGQAFPTQGGGMDKAEQGFGQPLPDACCIRIAAGILSLRGLVFFYVLGLKTAASPAADTRSDRRNRIGSLAGTLSLIAGVLRLWGVLDECSGGNFKGLD